MEQLAFIKVIAPWAIKDWEGRGILLPSVKIAQACLETGFGRSVPNNNLFGVKGAGLPHTTQEFIGGKWITITAGFEDYPTWEASVYGQSDFLVVNQRYKKILGNLDYFYVTEQLQAAGYATDPRYAEKLRGIIESYNLWKFDLEEDDDLQKPIIMDEWAWVELDQFIGDAYNDGTIEDWNWVEKVRQKKITPIEVITLKIFIDERRRLKN